MSKLKPPSKPPEDPMDALLRAHGLRKTVIGRLVLGWFLASPDFAVRGVCVDYATGASA